MSWRSRGVAFESKRAGSTQLPSLDALDTLNKALPSVSSVDGGKTDRRSSLVAPEPKNEKRAANDVSAFTAALLSALESGGPDVREEDVWTSAVLASLGAHGALDMPVAMLALETADMCRYVSSTLVENTPDASPDAQQLGRLQKLHDAYYSHFVEQSVQRFEQEAAEASVVQALGSSVGHATACMLGTQRALAFLRAADPTALDDDERRGELFLMADRVFDDAYATVIPRKASSAADATTSSAVELGKDLGVLAAALAAFKLWTFTEVLVIVERELVTKCQLDAWGGNAIGPVFVWALVNAVIVGDVGGAAMGAAMGAGRFILNFDNVDNVDLHIHVGAGAANAAPQAGQLVQNRQRGLPGVGNAFPLVRRVVGDVHENPRINLGIMAATFLYNTLCTRMAYDATNEVHRLQGRTFTRSWLARSDRVQSEGHAVRAKSFLWWDGGLGLQYWQLGPSEDADQMLVATLSQSRWLQLLESKNASLYPYSGGPGAFFLNGKRDMVEAFRNCWMDMSVVPMLNWQRTTLMQTHGITTDDASIQKIQKMAKAYAYATCAAGLNLVYIGHSHTAAQHQLSVDPGLAGTGHDTFYDSLVQRMRDDHFKTAAKDGYDDLKRAVNECKNPEQLAKMLKEFHGHLLNASNYDATRATQQCVLLSLRRRHRKLHARAFAPRPKEWDTPVFMPIQSVFGNVGKPVGEARMDDLQEEVERREATQSAEEPTEQSDADMHANFSAALREALADEFLSRHPEEPLHNKVMGMKLDLLFNSGDHNTPFDLQRMWLAFWTPALHALDCLARVVDALDLEAGVLLEAPVVDYRDKTAFGAF